MLHRLTVGSFALRLEAGLIGYAAGYTTLYPSRPNGWKEEYEVVFLAAEIVIMQWSLC